MKTSSTTEALPCAHDSQNSTGSTLIDQGSIELVEIFDLLTSHIVEALAKYDPAWSFDDLKLSIGQVLAKSSGYPFTKRDQQPYDIPRMFSLSLSPDLYEAEEDFDLVKRLFYLWAVSILYHARECKDIDAINRVIRYINVRLTLQFGGDDRVAAARAWVNANSWINELRMQHGLHDLASGQLVDSTEYTLRQTIFEINGFRQSGLLITGDMLETSNLRAMIFDGNAT